MRCVNPEQLLAHLAGVTALAWGQVPVGLNLSNHLPIAGVRYFLTRSYRSGPHELQHLDRLTRSPSSFLTDAGGSPPPCPINLALSHRRVPHLLDGHKSVKLCEAHPHCAGTTSESRRVVDTISQMTVLSSYGHMATALKSRS